MAICTVENLIEWFQRVREQRIIVLCNVFTLTRKTLDFKHASQKREKHKHTKEDEDICIAVL